MPQAHQAHPLGSLARNGELATKLMALRPGAALTLIGLGAAQLREVLPQTPSAPRMLRLDFADVTTTALAIDRILDDLADLATALWPDWDDTEPPQLSGRLLPAWRRAAIRFASVGRRPRFRRLARETELSHLLSVAEEPPCKTPWDLLLHSAIIVEQSPAEPAARRLILPSSAITSRGSAIERRMREALRAAPDLAGLFEDEVTLQLDALGFTPRVDLLWREGKVVVELDGAEHERDPNYGADRHRDYELLVAGYLVLRLTNAEVELDLGRSLEKVRRVVNMRRGRP